MRGVLLYAVRGALLWLCGGAAYVLHICTGTASHNLPSHRPFHILTPLPDMHSPCILSTQTSALHAGATAIKLTFAPLTQHIPAELKHLLQPRLQGQRAARPTCSPQTAASRRPKRCAAARAPGSRPGCPRSRSPRGARCGPPASEAAGECAACGALQRRGVAPHRGLLPPGTRPPRPQQAPARPRRQQPARPGPPAQSGRLPPRPPRTRAAAPRRRPPVPRHADGRCAAPSVRT